MSAGRAMPFRWPSRSANIEPFGRHHREAQPILGSRRLAAGQGRLTAEPGTKVSTTNLPCNALVPKVPGIGFGRTIHSERVPQIAPSRPERVRLTAADQ